VKKLVSCLIVVVVVAVALATGCCRLRPPRDVEPVERTLVTTGYCKCGECCGWRRTWYGKPVYSSGRNAGKRKKIGVTSSGTVAKPGTIAADTSRYPYGTIIYVKGYGYGRVEDIGGAVKGDHIDLYFRRHSTAKEWGRQSIRVKIWFP
jgi:3D (Asp-Asp-Asp) domain-containing protein